MSKLNKTSPWIKRYYELNEMFRYDKDISLITYDDDNKEIKLYVDNPVKAEALDAYLEKEIVMGNITLHITVVPNNDTLRSLKSSVGFEECFKNNEAVEDIVKINVRGFSATYIVFKKQVVQYFDDNLSDINGFCSTLYQDIANNIFADDHAGVFFCTSNVEHRTTVPTPYVTSVNF